jgi:hypothetical protein
MDATEFPPKLGGFFTRFERTSSKRKDSVMARVRLCEVCKKVIDPERAAGSPDTRLCKEHAVEIEKYGGEYKMQATQ